MGAHDVGGDARVVVLRLLSFVRGKRVSELQFQEFPDENQGKFYEEFDPGSD